MLDKTEYINVCSNKYSLFGNTHFCLTHTLKTTQASPEPTEVRVSDGLSVNMKLYQMHISLTGIANI